MDEATLVRWKPAVLDVLDQLGAGVTPTPTSIVTAYHAEGWIDAELLGAYLDTIIEGVESAPPHRRAEFIALLQIRTILRRPPRTTPATD